MEKTADRIYGNGKVYTIDGRNYVGEAVAVKDGKILFVGENSQMKAYEGSETEVVDLQGKTVFPGFIDTHLHTPGAGYIELFNVNLYHARSEEETLETIRKFVEDHPERTEYFGRGFNAGYFSEEESMRGPKKEKLNAICSEKPIILTDGGGHILWLNSKAFEIHGITRETESPAGGTVEKDPETGELWGTLKDYATLLVPYQSFRLEEKVAALKWMQEKYHSYGYTSIFGLRPPGSMVVKETLFDGLHEMEKQGQLKMRVNGARDMDPTAEIQPQIQVLKNLKAQYDSDLIRVTTAKFFGDGVIEGLTGCLLEPYEREVGKGENFYGEFIWDVDKLQEAFRQVMEAGFQIHMHTIGDGAVHYALDALEGAMAEVPEGEYRNTLTHLELVAEPDIQRMAKYNVIAAVQPYWHFKSPAMWEALERPALGKRSEREYPYKSFLDAGVRVTASSDHPVTPEPNPFHAIQAAVTRNLYDAASYGLPPLTDMDDPRWLMWKEERVNVLDVIKSFTIEGAYALCREDEIGSIEQGKDADFMIVNADPFIVDPLELEKIKVLETVFKGETVYKATH